MVSGTPSIRTWQRLSTCLVEWRDLAQALVSSAWHSCYSCLLNVCYVVFLSAVPGRAQNDLIFFLPSPSQELRSARVVGADWAVVFYKSGLPTLAHCVEHHARTCPRPRTSCIVFLLCWIEVVFSRPLVWVMFSPVGHHLYLFLFSQATQAM